MPSRTPPGFCAYAVSGQATAPPTSVMNSRRLIAAYLLSRRLGRVPTRTGGPEGVRSEAGFRFGSEADICNAKRHVRFTPDSDRESGHVPLVMSALSPKAD